MLKLEKFSGINNVLPSDRLVPAPRTGITPLAQATNVDIGLDNELLRRDGYSVDSATCHKNVWQANGFMLATANGGDLINVDTDVVLSASLGVSRVWYCNLPDGRTTFSNGLINGITDGTTATTWGVPHPASIGTPADVAGALNPGTYRYWLTHKRTADGLESGPIYSGPFTVAAGGLSLSALPLLTGHTTNVYITGENDDRAYYAGNTASDAFVFVGANSSLVRLCRTDKMYPAPVGTLTALFSGRALVAVGNVMYASRPGRPEQFMPADEYVLFEKDITLIQPVNDGVYVGTENELAFLAGRVLKKLQYQQVVSAGVVLGSGVEVRGELIQQREGAGLGAAMLCIADSIIVAGFNNGSIVRMTQDQYRTSVTEVAATFRVKDGIPQYIAIPQ